MLKIVYLIFVFKLNLNFFEFKKDQNEIIRFKACSNNLKCDLNFNYLFCLKCNKECPCVFANRLNRITRESKEINNTLESLLIFILTGLCALVVLSLIVFCLTKKNCCFKKNMTQNDNVSDNPVYTVYVEQEIASKQLDNANTSNIVYDSNTYTSSSTNSKEISEYPPSYESIY